MKDCRYINELFEKKLSDDLTKTENQILVEHLLVCEKCRTEYEELEKTIELLQKNCKAELNNEFLDNLWINLETKLEPVKSSINIKSFLNNLISSFRINPGVIYQLAGGTAILLLGLFIGKSIWQPEQKAIIPKQKPETIENISPVVQNVSQNRAERFLEKSKILLLGITNFDPATEDIDAIDLPKKQKISRQLLTQAAQLKNDLNSPSEMQLKSLISDLEVILLQIANLEAQHNFDAVEIVQSGVSKKGIFLKINLNEMSEAGNKKIVERKQNSNSKNL